MHLPGEPQLVDDGLDPLHPLLLRDVGVHAHHGLEDERLAHRQRPDEEVVLLHVPGHRRQRVRGHRHAVGVLNEVYGEINMTRPFPWRIGREDVCTGVTDVAGIFFCDYRTEMMNAKKMRNEALEILI